MKKILLLIVLLAFTTLSATAEMTPVPAPQSQDVTEEETCTDSIEDLAHPEATMVSSCVDAARVYYYSDASHTTQVGYCYHDCCELWTCTGELTDYYTVFKWPCDFN